MRIFVCFEHHIVCNEDNIYDMYCHPLYEQFFDDNWKDHCDQEELEEVEEDFYSLDEDRQDEINDECFNDFLNENFEFYDF